MIAARIEPPDVIAHNDQDVRLLALVIGRLGFFGLGERRDCGKGDGRELSEAQGSPEWTSKAHRSSRLSRCFHRSDLVALSDAVQITASRRSVIVLHAEAAVGVDRDIEGG